MDDLNLWPSKEKVFNLGEEAPELLLRRQASFLKKIDSTLIGLVNRIGFYSLDYFMNTDLCRQCKTPGAIPAREETDPVAFDFVIAASEKSYQQKILTIGYDLKRYYPVYLKNHFNGQFFKLNNKVEFINCLKEIFNSYDCINKLRYILTGPIG